MAFLIVAGINGDGKFTDPEKVKNARQQAAHIRMLVYDCGCSMSRSLMDCMICKVIGRQTFGGVTGCLSSLDNF